MSSPEDILHQAVAAHRAGDARLAEQLYRAVLKAQPRNADAHHLLGMIALLEGRAGQAVACIETAIDCNPAVPQYYKHLGAACEADGDAAAAVDAYRRRLGLEPNLADAHHDLAGSLRAAGNLPEAELAYRRALVIDPAAVETHNNLAITLHELGRLDEALVEFQQCVRGQPQRAQIHFNLGNCLRDLRRFEEAAAAYRQAVALDASLTVAWRNLGAMLVGRQQLAEAAECYGEALRVEPRDAEAHMGLGVALQSLGRIEEAQACYEQALEIDPANVTARFNLGSVLHTTRRLGEAQAAYEECVRLLPESVEMLLQLGKCLQVQGKYAEARDCYRRAIAIDPQFKHAHFFLGVLLLAEGDFAAGWREYEWRLKDSGRTFREPMWDGGNLAGRRILVHAEWGLGDTIMFLRYVPLVEALGGDVVLEVQPPLVPLVRQSGFKRVIAAGDAGPPCDVQVPLLSLPRIFGTTSESIPAGVPYLTADDAMVGAWRDELRRWQGFKLGIHWRGSPVAWGEARHIPLAAFEAIARVPGVTLFNLQKHQGADEVAALGGQFHVIDFDDEVREAHRPLAVTAAIMKNLDLVISCDTSVAHLAGALGVPVWVGLPLAADWRWLRDRDDSPWYPTMRLFRQRRQDDWAELFERMAERLRTLVAKRPT